MEITLWPGLPRGTDTCKLLSGRRCRRSLPLLCSANISVVSHSESHFLAFSKFTADKATVQDSYLPPEAQHCRWFQCCNASIPTHAVFSLLSRKRRRTGRLSYPSQSYRELLLMVYRPELVARSSLTKEDNGEVSSFMCPK